MPDLENNSKHENQYFMFKLLLKKEKRKKKHDLKVMEGRKKIDTFNAVKLFLKV